MMNDDYDGFYDWTKALLRLTSFCSISEQIGQNV